MPKTVLLADDSITIQRVVELTFANEDVRVVSVGDGDQAVASIRHSIPDLVLADIGMPGRSGYQVVEYVRSQPSLATLPVLLLAGAFEPVDQEQAHLVGADGILTKPFDPAVLIGRVNALLTSGRGGAAVEDLPSAVTTEAAVVPPVTAIMSLRDVEAHVPVEEMFADRDSMNDVPPATPGPGPEPDLPLSIVDTSATRRDADLYFEQIDQAFSTLAKNPRPPLPEMPAPSPADTTGDFFPEESASTPVPASPPIVPAVSLTDAFTALLDAERTGAAYPELRVSAPSLAPAAAPTVDITALVDEVTHRVLERLTDRIVRETVADIVARSAERLVTEEIERIKRNIK